MFSKIKFSSDELKEIVDELQLLDRELQGTCERAFDVRDEVEKVHHEMNDCEIPVNIKMRASELDEFAKKLGELVAEFRDLSQADDDFEGSAESEAAIKELRTQIDKKLKTSDTEKKEHTKFQRSKLEAYTDAEIMSL